jgi:hypothetical protein
VIALGLFTKVKDRFNKAQLKHKEKEEEREFQRPIEEEPYKKNYVKRGRHEARRRELKPAVAAARRDLDRHTPGPGAMGGFIFGGESAARRESAVNDILSDNNSGDDLIYGYKKKRRNEVNLW